MRTFFLCLSLVLSVVFFFSPAPTAFAAEGRVPISGPTTISQPGRYLLTQNITNTGDHVIRIESDDVDLDLGGFTITVPPTYFGVYSSGYKNLTISGGSIVGGQLGILLDSVSGEARYAVRNVRIRNPAYSGIIVSGPDTKVVEAVIENNVLIKEGAAGGYYGIELINNRGSLARDNVIKGFNLIGIYVDNCVNTLIESNRVSLMTQATSGSQGIYLESSVSSIVRNNLSESNGYGIYLYVSNGNVIASNNTSYNNFDGINIQGSNNNTVDGNMSSNNTQYGLLFAPGTSGNMYSNNRTPGNGTTGLIDYGSNTNMGNVWWVGGNLGTNPALDFLGTIDTKHLIFRTANVERMRIESDGDVGIGTNAPASRLEVKGGNISVPQNGVIAQFAQIQDANNDAMQIGENGGGAGRLDFFYQGGASATQNLLFSGGDSANGYEMDRFDVQATNASFSGNLGINTSTPDSALQVNGSTHISGGNLTFETAGALVRSISNAYDLVFRKDDNNDDTAAWFRFYTNGGTIEQIRVNDGDEAATLFDGAVTANGIDYAEAFHITDPSLEPGDVVALDLARPGYIQRAGKGMELHAIGVISEKPGFVTGSSFDAEEQADPALTLLRNDARLANDTKAEKQYTEQMAKLVSQTHRSVALLGRVPVKVDGSYGPIKPGDRLTASPTPGHAMALSSSGGGGPTIGIALEGWEAESTGRVMAFIQPGWSSTNGVEQQAAGKKGEEPAKNGDGSRPQKAASVAGKGGNARGTNRKTTTAGSRLAASRDEQGTDLLDELLRVDEEGNLLLRGAVMPSSTDIAQYQPASEELEPGDVVVIDREKPGSMKRSSQAADRAVAGVVASSPGILLGADLQRLAEEDPELWALMEQAHAQGETDTERKLWSELKRKFRKSHAPVALSGAVLCKADASFGAIYPGDLLVTSSSPGYAMRMENPYAGTIIAKALEGLSGGTGKIKVLVMLR